MKLFKSLLVAPATLGLLAPFSVSANEVNLNDISNYSNVESFEFANSFDKEEQTQSTLLAGGEGLVDSYDGDDSYDGGFSDTTVLDGKAVFSIGGLDTDLPSSESVEAGGSMTDAVNFQYMYVMNLNTSFTGDDNLYVRIKTGNGTKDKTFSEKVYGTYLSSANQNGDALKVDKIWYSAPLGDNITFYIGPKIENYYMHGTTPSIYKPVLKQFTLGGNASAYGASTSPGAGFVWSNDSGLALSTNFTTQAGNSAGLLTDENKTSWATQVGYTQPNYSVSAIINQKYNGWSDGYFSTVNGQARSGGDGSSTNIGLRAWWRPDETGSAIPSISVGYDTSETDATSNSGTDMYFVGLQWQDMFTADDRIGLALGQPQKREDETTDPFAWEAYYQFQVNDSVSVTPAVFGGTDRNGTAGSDLTGVVVETTFKF